MTYPDKDTERGERFLCYTQPDGSIRINTTMAKECESIIIYIGSLVLSVLVLVFGLILVPVIGLEMNAEDVGVLKGYVICCILNTMTILYAYFANETPYFTYSENKNRVPCTFRTLHRVPLFRFSLLITGASVATVPMLLYLYLQRQ
jgi:hypothetical protein